MCVARKQREGGEPSSGHYGRSMLSYSSTTEPNEYIYGRFCTAHFAAALLVPMSASPQSSQRSLLSRTLMTPLLAATGSLSRISKLHKTRHTQHLTQIICGHHKSLRACLGTAA